MAKQDQPPRKGGTKKREAPSTRAPGRGGARGSKRPPKGAAPSPEEERRKLVESRLVLKPEPPAGFDPLTASDEELASFGIPPRPREDENPTLFALWQQAVSPPVVFKAVRPENLRFDARYRLTVPRQASNNGAEPAFLTSRRYLSSRNWSGAYTVANRYRRFTAVGAAWSVSQPQLPPLAAGPPPDDDYIASVWTGLDGSFRRSRSLPQAGTSEIISVVGGAAGAPTYHAWFQWWLRAQLNPPVIFDTAVYPVQAGDRMICILVVNPPSDTVTILMTNLTQLWAAPLVYTSGNPLALLVEGSTAEWIVERPSRLAAPDQMHPLPDYGQIVFQGCATAAALAPPLGVAGNLRTARRVRMRLDVAGPPHRSAIISRPQKLGAFSVRLTYRAP